MRLEVLIYLGYPKVRVFGKFGLVEHEIAKDETSQLAIFAQSVGRCNLFGHGGQKLDGILVTKVSDLSLGILPDPRVLLVAGGQ